ncbi:MAG: phosphoribosylformylglycinamidine synthase [Saccharofermentanales bacterium]
MDEMQIVRRIFVEKCEEFSIEAKETLKDLKNNLGIASLTDLRILNRYDISGITDNEYVKAIPLVFSEPPVDNVYLENIDLSSADAVFAIESLPGQYDQRADSAAQCVQILTCSAKPLCIAAKVIVLYGRISKDDVDKIIDYMINPVECRQADLAKPQTLDIEIVFPKDVAIADKFIDFTAVELEDFRQENGFAMSNADMLFTQSYFKEEKRNPTITELRVLDTYWSDHCRHTTFLTRINSVKFSASDRISREIQRIYFDYQLKRNRIHGAKIAGKPLCLMDLATIAMKELRKSGKLDDLDQSEEINACSIRVPVLIDGKTEEYLVMFKNETHNHPTEIEPFGGAATCLGGAIRDPLSGRAYVYQAMRVTGSGDPTTPLDKTLPGKLSQKKISTGAAAGYSSYGNQIGLATGLVDELYHPGYVAKRMEIGAVIAAVPAANVVREVPSPGDIIILLGGRTGRDGCGGATGSSKEHDEKSIQTCGSEVQKGNPPTERKIQRLFREPVVSKMIKRCNDFGAGGVCVAIGELADGLIINLDLVPKKYEGLDGTELAISESQERMAVVISPENEKSFLEYSAKENLEATKVAVVIDEPRMEMHWRGKKIVDLAREFIDSNGAPQETDAVIHSPDMKSPYFKAFPLEYNRYDFSESLLNQLNTLNCGSKKGLAERFDSSIGANSVLSPFGGKMQLSPENGMAARIPVLHGTTQTTSLMTYGFDPYLSSWSPFHGAYYAVLESLSKIAAMGGDPLKARLTFQEYFERLNDDPDKWGIPFSALLGAYKAQLDFGTAAIGGKDSMSGTFKDLHVPPTLVSFAVGITDSSKVVSADFKKADRVVVLLPVLTDVLFMPVIENLLKQYEFISSLQEAGHVLSASTVRAGGVAVAVAKMAFGNMIGFRYDNGIKAEDLFLPAHGGIILEIDKNRLKADEKSPFRESLSEIGGIVLGKTTEQQVIVFGNQSISLNKCIDAWKAPLEKVFPTKTDIEDKPESVKIHQADKWPTPSIKTAKPRVFIPVFPGTNCEYDTSYAFELAGAIPDVVVFRNLSPSDIQDSINEMTKAIKESNIIMIPGGFSGGDEPEGSGKFIATAFRNPYVSEQIQDLLENRDGLIMGICNGFQALVKLGLLPYGEIQGLGKECPTLTFNKIGRHVSTYVRTKIISTKSPWLMKTTAGEVYSIPVSHGEGRFVASEELFMDLAANNQIATQYVDFDGNPSYLAEFNPNGSMHAIEGITSKDGRIFGKMGHAERIGTDVGKNIAGIKDQRLFESGVLYFK